MKKELRLYQNFIVRRLLILAVFLCIPAASSAVSITGGPHDRSSDPAYIASGIAGICNECHVPHQAFEIRIWSRDLTPNATDADELCLDCHDGAAPAWASSADDVSNLVDSFHDFSSNITLAPRGACSACHDIHVPAPNTIAYEGTFYTTSFLWIRDLDPELNGSVGTRLYQSRDIDTTSSSDKPNYLVGSTVLCYDCHSGNAGGNGPGDGLFNPDPQDIAFGGDGTDGDDRDVAESSGGTPGYYEFPDGTEPESLNSAPTLAQVVSGDIPGGHFIKSEMGQNTTDDNYDVNDPDGNLLYRISVGDKIPCGLCHDPHAGDIATSDDEVFFRRNIYAGENTIVIRGDSEFFSSLEASSPPTTRNGTGNGRLMCIYCHGTSDWDGTEPNPGIGIAPLLTGTGLNKYSVYGIKTIVGSNNTTNASRAFPPPLGPAEHTEASNEPCSGCHDHNNITAACGGCHDFPPTTGAHSAHSSTTDGKPGFNCETCHGPNPGSAGWHNESSASSYNENNSIHFNNITMSSDLNTTQRGVEDSYYNQTWTRATTPAPKAPQVTKVSGWNFVCTNVDCHGMDPVTWTWTQNVSPINAAPVDQYRLCGGCHGVTTNIDGTGGVDPDHNEDNVIDVASFYSRIGTLYEATNTAANYEGPVSGWARGGHGDSNINDPGWFVDSAVGTSVPVACVQCHDPTAGHFTLETNNPYRLLAAPGDAPHTDITSLCTQTNCHPKSGVDFAYLDWPKHSNDYHHNISGGPLTEPVYVTVGTAPINNQSAGSDTTTPYYDPVGSSFAVPVGLHIDRYVDHWGWWGSACTSGTTDDDGPFMPQGDSFSKSIGDVYDNNTSTVITCITCHNPHGSDLYVSGQTCSNANTLVMIPSNNMLRLRDQDEELCNGCHN